MGNKKFGLTTYVIVGIALVALYFVGKTVTPPPAAPPVEVKPVKATAPATPSPDKQKLEETRATEQQKARSQQLQDMAKHTKETPQANVKEFNPNSIDTDSLYWQDSSVKEGAVGVKEMAAKVAAAKAKLPPPAPPQPAKASPLDTSH